MQNLKEKYNLGRFQVSERLCSVRASLGNQAVKTLPASQETQIWSLDWEDRLEKEMATHSSFLAWKIPWTEGPGGLQSMESQESEMT